MDNNTEQIKLLASALYELRILLAPYLGDDVDADISIRIATHLVYALHNEALAIKDGQNFNMDDALKKIKAIDNIVGEEYADYFIEQFRGEDT
jgi:hypothetical protein